MNYELAKKLKDAGFPQKRPQELCPCNKPKQMDGMTSLCGHSYYQYVSVPTLEELIEACEEKFKRLVKKGGNKRRPTIIWHAQAQGESFDGLFGMMRTPDVHTSGSTPTEAVANLWLEIHAKIESTETTGDK